MLPGQFADHGSRRGRCLEGGPTRRGTQEKPVYGLRLSPRVAREEGIWAPAEGRIDIRQATGVRRLDLSYLRSPKGEYSSDFGMKRCSYLLRGYMMFGEKRLPYGARRGVVNCRDGVVPSISPWEFRTDPYVHEYKYVETLRRVKPEAVCIICSTNRIDTRD